VTLAIKALVRAEIESGRLVVPFDISAPAAYAYYLVTTEADASQPPLQAFREWLLEEAAPELGAD
jgi:LysR family glycine cleavage system transcriptional activator